MLGDPPRCATHGAVLTSGGTCLLCIKRLGDPSAPPTRNVLPWATAFVVGGLVVLAVVFKVYLSVSDKHPAQAATGDPAPAYGPPPLPTTVTTPTSRIPGNDRA